MTVLSNSPFISDTKIWFHERIIAFCVSIEDISLKRWDISNICSHSMHACETLRSDIDWADRENIDAPWLQTTRHAHEKFRWELANVCRVSQGYKMDLLGLHHWSWWYFPGLPNRYPTSVFRKHASNVNKYLRCPIFSKKYVIIHFQKLKYQNIIKQHFWKKHNDCLIQPSMPPISSKTQGKKHSIDI